MLCNLYKEIKWTIKLLLLFYCHTWTLSLLSQHEDKSAGFFLIFIE